MCVHVLMIVRCAWPLSPLARPVADFSCEMCMNTGNWKKRTGGAGRGAGLGCVSGGCCVCVAAFRYHLIPDARLSVVTWRVRVVRVFCVDGVADLAAHCPLLLPFPTLFVSCAAMMDTC